MRLWLDRPYARRTAPPRASKLDPFKGRIVGWLDAQPLSAQQVYQRLCAAGYTGGVSIVKDDVRRIRPRPREAFLTLAFAPGEVAQVDWGDGGAIAVGCLSSSWCWPTVARCMSHSPWRRRWSTSWPRTSRPLRPWGCRGGSWSITCAPPCSAIRGGGPVQFNPRYVDFARHDGFEIVACNVAKGNEKGRVERGVGYVKGNFLQGLELPAFAALNPAVAVWLETVANVRRHRETQRRPVDLWTEERPFLQPVNPRPFDVGRVLAVRASRPFRVTFEANRYSVPARYAGAPLILKAYPERVCLDHGADLIARHGRCYERQRDLADPDHAQALIAQRRHAQDAQGLQRFLAMGPTAVKYHQGLLERRGHALSPVRKILALLEIHGEAAVTKALADALAFDAFSREYIAHLLQARARPEPSPRVLTRRQEVLELELPPADLSVYAVPCHERH